MAAAAKLFIVVAGAPAAVAICQPLFDAMGQRTFPFGTEPAAASLVKLSGNFMLAATIEALGEALALVSKGGIEPGRFVDLLTSTLFPAPAYRTYGALIAGSQFQPAGFAAPLGHKDVRLLLAVAGSLGVPMPIGSLLNDRFLRLLAQGGESLDWSAISQLAAADAGLPRISRS
jgi:3-hydroxyisobutyrate dehydrogenase-like beta-hydroxyacid dehydrogenase